MMESFGKITDFWPQGVMEYVERLAGIYVRDWEYCNDVKVTFTEAPYSSTKDPAEFIQRLRELDAEGFEYSILSNVAKTFVRRYNEGRLTGYFSYDAYVKDEDIRQQLRLFGIDKDKFWLLLLFAYDYSESLCINGVNVAPSAYEQVLSLAETVDRLVTDFDEVHGTTLDREATMKLSVKGAKGVSIDSPTAIHFIAAAIEEKLKREPYWEEHYIMNWHRPLEDTKAWKDSPYIYYFAKMLLNFLRTMPGVRQLRKAGAKQSVKEMELVSRLVYFTKLSTNKKWLDIESQTLKAYLKQYKNLDTSLRRSSVYENFLI